MTTHPRGPPVPLEPAQRARAGVMRGRRTRFSAENPGERISRAYEKNKVVGHWNTLFAVRKQGTTSAGALPGGVRARAGAVPRRRWVRKRWRELPERVFIRAMSRWIIPRAYWETAKISVPTALEALVNRVDVGVCNKRVLGWAERLLKQADISLTIHGEKFVADDEKFIIMSNHQSLYDIPVLFIVFAGRTMRMVTKAELFKVPIWGAAMSGAGFVSVDRSNRKSAIDSLKEAGAAIRAGTDIWIAPEGTRSRTGEMGPFKKGGFLMALETGTRILPVTIWGTRDTLPAKGADIQKGAHVDVTISEPLDPSAYGPERRDELVADVRAAIAQYMPEEFRGEA